MPNVQLNVTLTGDANVCPAVLREQRIPFAISGSDDPFYSIKNQARLKAAMEQLKAGQGVAHDLIEVSDV